MEETRDCPRGVARRLQQAGGEAGQLAAFAAGQRHVPEEAHALHPLDRVGQAVAALVEVRVDDLLGALARTMVIQPVFVHHRGVVPLDDGSSTGD